MSLQPRSPDIVSNSYPDRAIRPKPKSRLKDKLSPQQQSTIQWPADPPPISPTLQYPPHPVAPDGVPYHERGGNAGEYGILEQRYPHLRNRKVEELEHHHIHENGATPVHGHCTCRHDADGESVASGDEEIEYDHPEYRYDPSNTMTGTPTPVNGKPPVDSVQRRLLAAAQAGKPAPPGSVASSADGYESFENTSNKKKRKIPLSSAGSLHTSSLSTEMASMEIGQTDGTMDTTSVHAPGHSPNVRDHYAAASPSASSSAQASGTGISGAGRGRYGRPSAKDRRPMGMLNGYNSRVPARSGSGSDGKGGTGMSQIESEVTSLFRHAG